VKIAYGNGLRSDVWEKFKQRFHIPYVSEFYGATEGNTTLLNPYNRTGAVGYISPLVKKYYPVKIFKFDIEKEELIRGTDGLCIHCKAGEKGELLGLIDGGILREFPGYTDKTATEKKVARDVIKKGDSWFRSGDILYQDKDGFLFFVDRIGDTFRFKGENVATNEVSDILCKVKDVQEVNVYGVAVTGYDGKAGMASIVMNKDKELDFHDFYNVAAKDLPLYSVPYFLRIQTEMEITSTFKHRKVGLTAEGFDPQTIKDALYFRDDKQKTYIPLDITLYQKIINSEIRL